MFLKGVFQKISNTFFNKVSYRKGNCFYNKDDVCFFDGNFNWCKLRCIKEGTTDTGSPDFSFLIEKDGDKIFDGTVVWVVEDLRSTPLDEAYSPKNHVHSIATSLLDGFMSASDKAKLDGISDNANNYSHPTSSGNKHIPAGGSSGQILKWGADGTAVWGNEGNTTYGAATTSAAGLMSSSDKSKLNKIGSATYGTTGLTTKIKINITSTTTWMLNFTVTLYQGYRATKVMVSGYQYGANHWYSPSAIILGDSGTTSLNVYFGYDDVGKLWVGFDGGIYTGISISDVCNGYTQIADFSGLFTISNVSSLETLQTTVTATHVKFTAVPTSGQVVVTDGTGGGIKSSGYTIASSVPSGAKFTDSQVTNTASNTTKFYLTGTSSGSTNTGSQYFDTGVYVSTTSGQLVTGSLSTGNIVGSGTITLTSATPTIFTKTTAFKKGTKPSANVGRWILQILDSAGTVAGGIYKSVNTSNVSGTYLYDYSNHTTGNTGHYIGVFHNASGGVYTYAPTPASSDNSTQIATTAYVRTVATSIANTAVSNHERNYRHYSSSCSSCGTSG